MTDPAARRDHAEPPGPWAREALAGTRFADVRWVVETGSTNADAMELARQGEPAGIVLVADHQTAGRGRRGRTWQAPPGAALTTTILLRPRAEVAGLVTMAVGLAALAAVEELTGLVVRLKWPNDLVWPGDGSGPDRKLAGILSEAEWPAASQSSDGWSAPAPAARVAVAVGIGLNVAWGEDLPPDLVGHAVALDELVAPAPPPDRAELLVALLRHLDGLDAVLAGPDGAAATVAAWQARSATIGRRVRIDLGSDDLEGTAVGISAEGHLVVETVEGDRRTVAVGDVVHLRPAR